jgi:hypothetical protein
VTEKESFLKFDFQIAKRLKHESDNENEPERRKIKFLQAVLYFSLCANYQETRPEKSEKISGFSLYKETLDLIRLENAEILSLASVLFICCERNSRILNGVFVQFGFFNELKLSKQRKKFVYFKFHVSSSK